MTNTRPCRLTSLQFSQIRLTLERTFMANLNRAETFHESQGIFHCRDVQTRDKTHFADFLPFFLDLPDEAGGTISSRTYLLKARKSVVSSVVSLSRKKRPISLIETSGMAWLVVLSLYLLLVAKRKTRKLSPSNRQTSGTRKAA